MVEVLSIHQIHLCLLLARVPHPHTKLFPPLLLLSALVPSLVRPQVPVGACYEEAFDVVVSDTPHVEASDAEVSDGEVFDEGASGEVVSDAAAFVAEVSGVVASHNLTHYVQTTLIPANLPKLEEELMKLAAL